MCGDQLTQCARDQEVSKCGTSSVKIGTVPGRPRELATLAERGREGDQSECATSRALQAVTLAQVLGMI